MTTTVSSNYSGFASGGTLPVGSDGLVPVGVSVISSGSVGLAGYATHSLQVFGNVYGENGGIALGDPLNRDNSFADRISVYAQGSVSGNFAAIYFNGWINTLTNNGNISSQYNTVRAANIKDGSKLFVNNFGTISSMSQGTGTAIDIEGGGALRVKNFGAISAIGFAAISSIDGSGDQVYNRGTIAGDIRLQSLSAQIINRGIISGDIVLSAGTNLLDNRGGTIDGTIQFGTGDDTFRPGVGVEIATGGNGSDTVDFTLSGVVQFALDDSLLATGAAKDDSYAEFENIIGSKSGNDVLIGDEQANALSGLSGADKLSGQAGADTLSGGAGNDTLDGGADNDALIGDGGNDILLGGLGNDTLTGGAGNDSLTGGAASDLLTGDVGADRFIFLAKDFVGINQNKPDEVTDFSQLDVDLIDLSAVDASTKAAGDQAFTFIGAGPFHNIAGELRFQQVSGNTYIFGDTNGDGVSDFTIMLDGLLTPTAKDFIL